MRKLPLTKEIERRSIEVNTSCCPPFKCRSTLNKTILPPLVFSLLVLFLTIPGCITPPPKPPPAPILNSSLLEGQTSLTGTGVSNGMVDVLLNGTQVAKIKVTEKGNFQVDVPPLKPGQVITATQTITGQTSPLSLPVIVKRATLTEIEIYPVLPLTIEQGQTRSFTVRGLFSNGRIEDPLTKVTWSIGEPSSSHDRCQRKGYRYPGWDH